MRYGLSVRDQSGRIVLDTSDRVSRIIWWQVVSGSSSDTITLSDYKGKEFEAVAISIEVAKQAHAVSFNKVTGVYSWTAQSNGYYSSSQSLVMLLGLG